MWNALMTCGTLYDGKERIAEISLGTLATGDYQEALQLGSIHKGDLHEVSTVGVDGPWIAHTHGEYNEKGQKYHPPSLQDILVTIQRTVNNKMRQGISVVVTMEGFYILYPMSQLITRLCREIGYDRLLAKEINDFYPEVFTKLKSGSMTPDVLSGVLKKYNIVCEFILRPE